MTNKTWNVNRSTRLSAIEEKKKSEIKRVTWLVRKRSQGRTHLGRGFTFSSSFSCPEDLAAILCTQRPVRPFSSIWHPPSINLVSIFVSNHFSLFFFIFLLSFFFFFLPVRSILVIFQHIPNRNDSKLASTNHFWLYITLSHIFCFLLSLSLLVSSLFFKFYLDIHMSRLTLFGTFVCIDKMHRHLGWSIVYQTSWRSLFSLSLRIIKTSVTENVAPGPVQKAWRNIQIEECLCVCVCVYTAAWWWQYRWGAS